MRARFRLFVLCLSSVTPVVALADAAPPTVARVVLEGEPHEARVSIRGSFEVPTYAVRAFDDGRRVVVEVAGARIAPDGVVVEGSAKLVTRATASSTASGVRVEILLSRVAAYRARALADRIDLSLDARGEVEAPVETVRVGDGPAEVRHVIVERRNERERVVVELDRAASFRVVPGQEGPARLEIEGAVLAGNVPDRLEGGADSVIRSVEMHTRGSRVLVEVERLAGSSGTAIREGERIVWMFAAPPDVRPSGVRTVSKESTVEVDGEEVAAFLSDVPLQIGPADGATRRYGGRRIDIDFKDADIHNILRLLSEVGNVNIVTADDVSGTVTIKMRSVPWDQALDVILTAKGLGMVRRDNLIRVAPLERLEREREMAIARRRQKVELAPLETRLIPVSYSTASEMQARVKEMLSERGSVSVDTRTNMLLVRDIAEYLEDAEELVRQLDSQTPQVLIEARVVEATTAFTHDFGIQWGGSYVASSVTGNPTGLVFPHDVTVAGGATDGTSPTAGLSPFTPTVPNPNYVVNFPAPAGTGQGGAIGLTLGSLSGNFNVALRLSAFETTGNVRIISSPRILTLDNESATISQGTSIPYSQVSAQGVQTAFQEARISLTVTPHVTNDGAVALDVNVTRDEPDFNQRSARGDPTILKRNANTKLLVQDGHTAVIGGIYTRNSGNGYDKVPFFGDLPILGILFSHTQHRDGRGEMLIFLTPRIVNRGAALGHY